jgi:hypothetical protein
LLHTGLAIYFPSFLHFHFPVRKGLLVNFWAYFFRFGKIRRLLPAGKRRKLTVHIYFEGAQWEKRDRTGTFKI